MLIFRYINRIDIIHKNKRHFQEIRSVYHWNRVFQDNPKFSFKTSLKDLMTFKDLLLHKQFR